MEVLATPLPPRPNHSLSYNDLKKRRLQRSNSHKKITISHQQSTQVKRRHLTEQKSNVNHLPRNEKALMNAIGQIQGTLGQVRNQRSEKKFFSLRESMTDRQEGKAKMEKKDKSEKKNDNLWNNIDEGTQTRKIIRSLLSRKKSQHRLMNFNEVRNKLKMQKQKSRSRQKSSTIKQIASPFKTKVFEKDKMPGQTIEELINKKTTKPIVEERQRVSMIDKSLEELTNCNPDLKEQIWKEEILGKQNNQKVTNILDVTEISQIQKSEEVADITQSCALIVQKTHVEGSFLRLLDRPKEIQNKIFARQTRRRCDIDRIRRIFPSGFFAS